MHFEYTQYVRGCLVIPILVSLFALSILISVLSHMITVTFQQKLFARDSIGFLLAILICVFFLSMNMGRLAHGGIHLIYEREYDAVELHGEIMEIKELGRYSFPELKSEYGYGNTNGVQFLIDGIEYTAVTQGTLQVGNHVTIVVLPQSRYILSIEVDDSKTGDGLRAGHAGHRTGDGSLS